MSKNWRCLFLFTLCIEFCSLVHADLKFAGTQVFTPKAFQFSPLPSANAFVSQNSEANVTIVRTTPVDVITTAGVERIWKENLLVAGSQPKKGECKSLSRHHFVCTKQISNKKILLSWNQKDLISVVVEGKKSSATNIHFGSLK